MGTQSNKHRATETSELDRQLKELPPLRGWEGRQIQYSAELPLSNTVTYGEINMWLLNEILILSQKLYTTSK